MAFVAVAKVPPGPAALQRAADIAGLALPDATRILAGALPRILVRATQEGARLVGALETAGFIAFEGDPAAVVTDARRIVARDLELADGLLAAVDGRGQRHACPTHSIRTLLRGIRLAETTVLVEDTQRKLSLGRALLTGGLAVTRKVETTTERTAVAKEAFLLLQRTEGLPEIMLHERRLDYRSLGVELQPATFANFTALVARLRALAPHAAFDDRITRPGFLAGLPPMAMDPADLAVFLVTMARERGCV